VGPTRQLLRLALLRPAPWRLAAHQPSRRPASGVVGLLRPFLPRGGRWLPQAENNISCRRWKTFRGAKSAARSPRRQRQFVRSAAPL